MISILYKNNVENLWESGGMDSTMIRENNKTFPSLHLKLSSVLILTPYINVQTPVTCESFVSSSSSWPTMYFIYHSVIWALHIKFNLWPQTDNIYETYMTKITINLEI